MLWSPSWKSALYHTLIWIEYLIFYFISREIIRARNGYQMMIGGLTLIFLLIGIPAFLEYCSFQYFGGATQIGMRFSKYGEQVVSFFPLVLVGILRYSKKRFLIGLFVISILWLFIISTLGRTNLLLFTGECAAILGIIFIFKRFHRYRLKALKAALTLLLIPVPAHLVTFFTSDPGIPIIKRMSDAKGISYSGNFRKLMYSVSFEMFAAHPLTGIGAGNFGIQFNNYRMSYAVKNPTDVNLMTAENELAERSHSEYIQILAELGIPGLLIFAAFLIGIVLLAVESLKSFRRISLFQIAALTGVFAFLLSSMISSFSFRLMQNGLVFFFVLAVAAKLSFRSKSDKTKSEEIQLSANGLKLGYAMGMIACISLAGYCLSRAMSSYYTNQALQTGNFQQAEQYFVKAARLDNENPDLHFVYGARLIGEKNYAEAAEHFQKEIRLGRATATDYAYLAMAQNLSENPSGAEKTFADAAKLYPFSPFVRTRYAAILNGNGKSAEAENELAAARKINLRETNTWWKLINDGSKAAQREAFGNDDFIEIPDMPDGGCFRIILAERRIKYGLEEPEIKFDN
ncbi:MAG: O-antigen ligase family protein [Pyrinomonadaceae bacterium]